MHTTYLHNFAVAAICVVCFFAYSAVYFSVRPAVMESDYWIFNTPDETANYFFIERVIGGEDITYPEPLNSASEGLSLVHPRSTTVVDNNIVPGSFLGFIVIMETLGRVLGTGFIPYIIPLTSVVALLSFYLLLRRYFNRRIALVSLFLLAILPAYWYYNSRSLFNNVLFVNLLIIGLYQLQRYLDAKRWQALLLSGLIIGAALTIRTTDVVWVGLLLSGIVWFQRHLLVSWLKPLILFGAGVVAAFVPILQLQATLYGSPFVTGYVPEGIVGEAGTIVSTIIAIAQQFILPFGFHPLTIAHVLYHYGLKMFWWHIILGGSGIVLLLWQWSKKKILPAQQVYLGITFAVSLFILSYYGSWSFSNNLSGQALIGSSQARYLLPVYILLIPAIAILIVMIVDYFKRAWVRQIFIMIILGVCMSLSVWVTLFKGPESLLAVRQTIIGYHQLSKHIQLQTEDDAVIVTSYHDKVFFPARKIIFYWDEPEYLHAIGNILTVAPIYFYSINSDTDRAFIENNSDLRLEYISSLRPNEILYKITK
jgi:hypothetical protein